MLVEAGIDINVRDLDRRTPLFNSNLRGHLGPAEPLTQPGTGVNVANMTAENPIQIAAAFDEPKKLHLPLEGGANHISLTLHLSDLGRCATRVAGAQLVIDTSHSKLRRLHLDVCDREGRTAKDYTSKRIMFTDHEIAV